MAQSQEPRPEAPAPKKKRGWPRYLVAALLCLTAFLGAAGIWWAVRVHNARKRAMMLTVIGAVITGLGIIFFVVAAMGQP